MSFALLAMLVLDLGAGSANLSAGAAPTMQSASRIMQAKPAAAPHFEGSLDIVEAGFVRGWAWDVTQPNTTVKVDIYDGATLLVTIAASDFREDLKGANKGDGKHAFNYALAAALRDGQSHTISVRFAGSSSELAGSPKSLVFPKP